VKFFRLYQSHDTLCLLSRYLCVHRMCLHTLLCGCFVSLQGTGLFALFLSELGCHRL